MRQQEKLTYLTGHDRDQTISATKCCFFSCLVSDGCTWSVAAISHLCTEVWCWKMLFPVMWCQQTITVQRWQMYLSGPNAVFFFLFFLHHKAAPALHVTAQHTQTLTHRGRRRIQRVQLYLWLVKRFILCSSRPLASKRGGSDWRDSISWVGSRSLHGRRREEEIKLLAFVGGLGIKHGGGA